MILWTEKSVFWNSSVYNEIGYLYLLSLILLFFTLIFIYEEKELS